MKHLCVYISLALGTVAVEAADPWAERAVVVAARENQTRSDQTAKKPEEVTVLPRILEGQPVRVNIEGTWVMSAQTCDKLKDRVRVSYNSWFQNASNLIRAQRREQEFGDVLPTLRRGVPLDLHCGQAGSSNTPADVTVHYKPTVEEVRKVCGENAVGCQAMGGKGEPMRIVVPLVGSKEVPIEMVDRALVHELGHTLGMADTYPGAYQKDASAKYRSKQQTSRTVMSGTVGLSPDDADGLINMIDAWNIHRMKQEYRLNWEKHASPRVLKGWGGLNRDARTGSSMERFRRGTSEKIWLGR